VLGHLQSDFLPLAGFGHGLVLDLHGLDALTEIARVSEDADRLADAQGSRFQPYRGDGKMTVVVRHDADELFAGERFRGAGATAAGFGAGGARVPPEPWKPGVRQALAQRVSPAFLPRPS